MEKKSSREILDSLELKQLSKDNFVNYITEYLSESGVNRVVNCGNWLQIISNDTADINKIVKANCCKDRNCPICSVTKSRKGAVMLNIILNYLKKEYDYEFIFLTLTVPNVKSSELKNELNEQYEALQRLRKRKEFLKISKGWIRKTEITYNSERNDYHPHIHMLIAVNKSYFKSRDYIKKEKWLELWRECKRDNSITQVDIRKADDNSFLEIAKYETKNSDVLNNGKEVFEIFYKTLKSRKTLTFNGCFDKAKKLYNANELDYLKELDLTEYVKISSFGYNKILKKYEKGIIRELSADEKEKYNKLSAEIEIE